MNTGEKSTNSRETTTEKPMTEMKSSYKNFDAASSTTLRISNCLQRSKQNFMFVLLFEKATCKF
jgi:hypothetical protein